MAQAAQPMVTIGQVERIPVSRWHVMFLIAISLGIVVCEYIFAYQNVAYGIAIALALVVLIYVVLSTFNLGQMLTNTAESLALIPLYILFTSSLPWFFINQQYLLPAVYSCILGLVFWHIYQNKLSFRQIFGFSKKHILKYSLIGIPRKTYVFTHNIIGEGAVIFNLYPNSAGIGRLGFKPDIWSLEDH